MAMVRYIHFDSIAELCAAAPSEVNRKAWQGVVERDDDRRGSAAKEWFGVTSRSATIRAVEQGWEEGAARLFDSIGRVDAKRGTIRRRRRIRGDHGDELDIHRVYRGQIDTAWQRAVKVDVESIGVVRIVMQIGALAHVSSEEMFWRGAACAVIADALENAGNRVEIMGYSSCEDILIGNYDHLTITFPIKAAGQPLDISAIAATACLAGFHRHYVFKARCSHESAIRSGMGTTQVGVPPSLAEPGMIHVSLQDVNSLETAIAFVKRHLHDEEALAA